MVFVDLQPVIAIRIKVIFIPVSHYLRKYILLVVFITSVVCVRAQSYWDNYELISTRQGLPHNIVNAILQDSEGFIWIGTYNGLCIYHNNRPEVYKNVFKTSGDNNWYHAIEKIYEDRDKNIWVGSRGGLVSCFQRKTNSFKLYDNKHEEQLKINCFYQDVAGRIWVGYANGNISQAKNDSVFFVGNAGDEEVLSISGLGQDSLLLVTRSAIKAYDIHTATTTTIAERTKMGILSALPGPDGKILINEGENRYVYNPQTRDKICSLPFSKSAKSAIYHNAALANDGGYYYTDGIVISEYDADCRPVNSFVISDNVLYNKNEIINCMTEDRSGILWMGTNSGLYKIDKRRYLFKKYSQANTAGLLTDNYVRSIYNDKSDNLWVGFKANGVDLLKYDVHTKRYTLSAAFDMRFNSGLTKQYTTNTFLQLKSGKILAGTDKGPYVIDVAGKVLEPFMPGVLPDSFLLCWSLYEDEKGYIWAGSGLSGLYIIHPDTKEVYHYNTGKGLYDNAIWQIYGDKNGNVWIGTDKGLNEVAAPYDVNNLGFKKHELLQGERVHVWSFVEDKTGVLWIGSTGHGIFRHDADSSFKQLLPNTVASAIEVDSANNLWISTVNGLYKYDGHDFSYFDEQDGLISNDFNFKAAAATVHGELFFGSKMGMIGFVPGTVYRRDFTDVPVRITNVSIAGKDTVMGIGDNTTLTLPYDKNHLGFGFTILDYSKPKSHRYRYMLKGFDDEWKYQEANRQNATYTNLPPGKYVFVVEGSADGQQWSRNNATMHLDILPAFWQRPVFWIICIVILVLLSIAVIYYRIRNIVKKERERHLVEKQIAELELMALQSQMNPHFIFNTINAIQDYIIHHDEISANEYLSKFARLMRLLLEASKSRYITVANELELLGTYMLLEKLRFEDKFDYEIETVNKEKLLQADIPSMLIQPFVENAINHGLMNKQGKGMLKLHFSYHGGGKPYVKCIIDDNGIGRQKAEELKKRRKATHASRGIELIQERIKTYNFIDDRPIRLNITDKQLPEEGTIVELIIPVA